MLKNKLRLSVIVITLTFVIIGIKYMSTYGERRLEEYSQYVKSLKHPNGTTELYFDAFHGNSTGTSDHTEYIITEIRKYNPEKLQEIKDFYKGKGVTLSFVNSLYDCEYNSVGWEPAPYLYLKNKPVLTPETAKDFLPAYIITYWKNY